MITVTAKTEAWDVAMALLGGKMNYNLDKISSEKAGYNVFRSEDSYYNYICDLGDRLEVNMDSGITKNIWIGKQEEPTKEIIHEYNYSSNDFLDKVADKVAEKLLKSLQK